MKAPGKINGRNGRNGHDAFGIDHLIAYQVIDFSNLGTCCKRGGLAAVKGQHGNKGFLMGEQHSCVGIGSFVTAMNGKGCIGSASNMVCLSAHNRNGI